MLGFQRPIMSETVQRVARPTGSIEPDDGPSSSNITIRRNTLTLYISFTAIILSVASAGVNLWTFYAAGQQKMVNEADQIFLRAEANRILRETHASPGSHPKLAEQLKALYQNVNYRPNAEVPLSLFERAAFSLMVESYAVPLREVQLKRSEVLVKLSGPRVGLGPNLMCDIDVHDPACPDEIRGLSPLPFPAYNDPYWKPTEKE